jgi:hypothetical protein
VQTKSALFKYYYGNNFSGFCYDWSTEEISLTARGKNTYFQGDITEEWLMKNKGFEKTA